MLQHVIKIELNMLELGGNHVLDDHNVKFSQRVRGRDHHGFHRVLALCGFQVRAQFTVWPPLLHVIPKATSKSIVSLACHVLTLPTLCSPQVIIPFSHIGCHASIKIYSVEANPSHPATGAVQLAQAHHIPNTRSPPLLSIDGFQ